MVEVEFVSCAVVGSLEDVIVVGVSVDGSVGSVGLAERVNTYSKSIR